MRALLTIFAVGFVFIARAADAPLTPENAAQHVGELVTIRAVVADVHTTGKGDTFINFGAAYPKHTFSAVIFRSVATRFPVLSLLKKKTVAVTGTVELYRNKPQIVLTRASQLKVE